MHFILSLLFLSLLSCSKSDNSKIDKSIKLIRHLNPKLHPDPYKFDMGSGNCTNSKGEIGHHRGLIGECGDLRNADLGDRDMRNLIFWGARMEGADLSKSRYTITDLALHEVAINEATKLNDTDKTAKKFIEQHKKVVFYLKSQASLQDGKLKDLREKFRELKEIYLEAKESEKAGYMKKLDDLSKDMHQNEIKRSELDLKRTRHVRIIRDLDQLL